MEENKDSPKTTEEFGKVIDTLHTKSKLSTLRTYQGDVAEFIKDKNQSTLSIALEEKHKQEQEIEEGGGTQETGRESLSSKNLGANFTALVLSITLLIAGVFASIFIFDYLTKPRELDVSLKTDIIPYNNEITLANMSSESFAAEIKNLPPQNGISIVDISDNQGNQINTSASLFDFLNIRGRTVTRYFDKNFVLGVNGEDGLFLIFETSDFGATFSGMLDWEKYIEQDLSFIFDTKDGGEDTSFSWKDAIIKNKDVRVLSDGNGTSRVYYSFLDKNTLAIVGDEKTLTDIFSSFASKPFVR
jgi:hypothetical protein